MYPAYGTHLGLHSVSMIDHLLIWVLFVTAYCTVFIARTLNTMAYIHGKDVVLKI